MSFDMNGQFLHWFDQRDTINNREDNISEVFAMVGEIFRSEVHFELTHMKSRRHRVAREGDELRFIERSGSFHIVTRHTLCLTVELQCISMFTNSDIDRIPRIDHQVGMIDDKLHIIEVRVHILEVSALQIHRVATHFRTRHSILAYEDEVGQAIKRFILGVAVTRHGVRCTIVHHTIATLGDDYDDIRKWNDGQ